MFILILFALYFIPTLEALIRRAKKSNGVFVVNFFLGWTFIGWVVALAWAVSSETS
jgi:Superinfection immunity protein